MSLSKAKCDVCKSSKFKLFKKIELHQYDECIKCGTICLTTRELNKIEDVYPDTYLEDPEKYNEILNPDGTRYMAGNVDYAYENKVGPQKGELLEIGAGTGFLSYMLFSRGWNVKMLELSESAALWQKKNFKLPVECEFVEDYKTRTKYDAVVLVEVVEHFYDPRKALKKINKLLGRKRLIFGTTPNIDSRHWKDSDQDIYQPDDHIVLFNTESLKKLLGETGFNKIDIKPFGVGDNNDSNLMFSAVKK